MQTTSTPLPPLAEYLDRREAQRRLAAHYPTEQSFAWFIRRHRDRLAESGAMIVVAGRQKFHPGLTEQVVLEAGRRAAMMEADE
jgi:hypothetical protein